MTPVILGSAAVALAQAPAAPASPRPHSFTVTNGGLTRIVEWRIAVPGSGAWGPNLIQGPPVAPGEVRKLIFSTPGDICVVDVKIALQAGGQTLLPRQDSCDPAFVGHATVVDAPAPPAPPAPEPAN